MKKLTLGIGYLLSVTGISCASAVHVQTPVYSDFTTPSYSSYYRGDKSVTPERLKVEPCVEESENPHRSTLLTPYRRFTRE